MKKINIFISAAAAALLLTACDESKMQWGVPEGHYAVTSADIPLAVAEQIANYEPIKTYAVQYTPNLIVGLGFGATQYVEGGLYKQLTDENFQMVTPGNEMKMDAVVKASGVLNFEGVDAMLDAMSDTDLKLYGHNFIWHTQQQATWLKSLISPTMVVESDSNIKNMIGGDSFDFEGGTTGSWGCWGGNNPTKDISAEGEGFQSKYSMVLVNPVDAGSGNAWKAQCAYTFNAPLEKGVEYTIRFKAKSSTGAGVVQFQYQNSTTYGSQGGYNSFAVGTDWVTCEYTFEMPNDDDDRIIINFGEVAATYYIDNVEFGVMEADPMENVMSGDNSDFEGGQVKGWGCWGGNNPTMSVSDEGEGYESSYSMKLVNPVDAGSGNAWKAQCAYTFDAPLQQGKKYIIQFYAKSDAAAGTVQFQYQNSTTYGSQGGYNSFAVGTDWVLCEYTFEMPNDDDDRIIINFGEVAATYYIDNVKFGLAKNQSAAPRKARTYYVLKSAEEKRQVLVDAMDTWIKGMGDHLKEKGIKPYGYDVINEAIADGSNLRRGVDNVFNGTDTEPVETEDGGLTIDWENGHFYWGYYVPDYAVLAFQKAKQYLPEGTKLFYNDYNLETSEGKRKAAIQFVKDIDTANGSPIVDGIGTQMRLTLNVSEDDDLSTQIEKFMAQVDASLTELATTGKLIRITELDIALGTSNPASYQLEAQYEAYRRVFESYKRIIPEAQQSGITIWTLSDNPDEHEYWLPNESPNLWDKDYKRKWAYKGVCDGIAGEDIGKSFNGDDYKKYYE